MTTTREDLRDHLTAVIEAAQELPKEDRPYGQRRRAVIHWVHRYRRKREMRW